MQETGIDLDALDTRRASEEGVELQLKDPRHGAPLAAWVRVRGYDSASYDDAQVELQRRRIQRMPAERPTPETLREDALDLAASLVAGWRGLTRAGAPIAYSAPAARALLRDYPWVREQVEAFAAQRANFLPPPVPS